MITFRPEDTQINVTFAVLDDSIALEATESFDWSLTLITIVERASVSPYNTTNIQIMDDDGECILYFVDISQATLQALRQI